MGVAVLSLIFLFALTTGSVAFASTITGAVAVSSLLTATSEFSGIAFTIIPAPKLFVVKTEAEIDVMTHDELKTYRLAEIDFQIEKYTAKLQPELDAINEKISEGKNVTELKAEIEAIETKLNKAIAELNHFGLKMKSQSEGVITPKGGQSIEAILKSKESEIKKMLNKELKSFEFEIPIMKATQVATDINTGTDFAQMLPGVGKIPHRRNYLKDRIRVIGTNTEYIKYLDQKTVVRDAKNVAACGDTTHLTKLTWETFTMQQQKIRDFVDICIDMLEDYAFVEAEIRDLITSSVALKVDNQLLIGTGTAPQLNSIDSIASTFDAGLVGADYTASISVPTIIDLVVVAGAQIEFLGSNNFWKANTAYLNPRDLTLIKLYKDNERNYIKSDTIMRVINNVNGNLEIDGIELIANPGVDANEMYVFDSTRARIYQRRNAVIEMSYENNDNFENETVTVKAYERLNMLIRSVDANAFMHITDIDAAIADLTIVT